MICYGNVCIYIYIYRIGQDRIGQYSIVQYSTVQYSILQHSIVMPGGASCIAKGEAPYYLLPFLIIISHITITNITITNITIIITISSNVTTSNYHYCYQRRAWRQSAAGSRRRGRPSTSRATTIHVCVCVYIYIYIYTYISIQTYTAIHYMFISTSIYLSLIPTPKIPAASLLLLGHSLRSCANSINIILYYITYNNKYVILTILYMYYNIHCILYYIILYYIILYYVLFLHLGRR